MTTKIKYCGFTQPEDVQQAIDIGVDYIGLIFAEQSPRSVNITQAETICSAFKAKTKLVGIFQNQSLDWVQEISQKLDLDFIQLHGDESIEYCNQLKKPIIKAISITSDASAEKIISKNYRNLHAVLLDAPKHSAIPSLDNYRDYIQHLPPSLPYFVAGRLTIETINACLTALTPWGIDVASGIEHAPGQKDTTLMREFYQAVLQFEQEENKGENV